MTGTIFLTVSALFYTLINTFIFIKKKKVNKLENKIYGILLILSIFSMISELSIIFTSNIIGIGTFVQKLYLAFIIVWLCVFMLYTFVVVLFNSHKKDEENIEKYKIFFYAIAIIGIILILLVFLLPIYFNFSETKKYTYGPSVDVVFKTAQIYTFIMMALILTHFKKINKKGYLPIISLIIMLILTSIIQKQYPDILLTNFVFGFIVYLMYHTIENPDVKMVSALNQNRILIEKNNEEKSNLLFKVSQEIKRPIVEITKANEQIQTNNDLELIKYNSKIIDLNVKNLMSISDNLLDISKMDSRNIKIDNTSYNVINLFNEIKVIAKNKMNKNLDFRFSISNIVPEYLYGDAVRLKQVIVSLLLNSIKYTKHGFIEMEVNSIIKYDMCRLMITVADSGCGIDLNKINEILSSDANLTDEELDRLTSLDIDLIAINKVVKMLNGTMIIKSEIEKGSEFLIIIDQKIKVEESDVFEKVEKYSKDIFNHKKVLVIDDDMDMLSKVEKILEQKKYEVIKSSFGTDCLDRLNNSSKFDFIIIDDVNVDISALDLLKKIRKNNIDIPVLVMLTRKKEFMSKHYIDDGFTDYIVKDDLDKEFEKLDKYV